MDVKTAALHLAVEPKKLRAFLRTDPRYQSPGAGGRYDLSQFSLEELRASYEAWARATTPRVVRSASINTRTPDYSDSDAPLPLGSSQDEVRAHTARREARLNALLKARGLHLAAMTSHESWERATTARTTRKA